MQTSSQKRFGSRQHAGRALAKRLAGYTSATDVVVLALPKGGVAVGAEIAAILGLPFDVLLVGRITTPGCGGTPLGAITSSGVRMLNHAMIDSLRLSDEEIRQAVLRKSLQLARRERLYRSQRPSIDVADQTVILVDDGTAPCATLRNAIRLLRRQHADHVVVAVPITCQHAACDLRMEADEVVTLEEASADISARKWFESFPPATTAEGRLILSEESEENGHHN
jgi:predicted phosphoribosyltransferase